MIIDIYKLNHLILNMDNETKKVSWNASQGIIMEISNRRSLANTLFINNQIKKAFNTLIAIKQSVIQSFNKPEREKLNEIEKKFNQIAGALVPSASHSFNTQSRINFKEAQSLAINIYSEYNELIMDLLEDRGYLISEQTDASKMKF